MDAYKAIISKRDIRHYTDEPISDEIMEDLLQAARMAGSAKNHEVNRLIVVKDQEVQDALAASGDFSSWIGNSPVIIGFASPVESLRAFDIGRQAQNIMVAANAVGVATCPVTMHHPEKAKAAVGLPDDWVMPIVLTLGWPDPNRPDSPLKRDRVPLEELVREDRWS